MICVCPKDICIRNLQRKVEKGYYQVPTSILLQDTHTFCARMMGALVALLNLAAEMAYSP
jgi:hypothetical protein